MVAWLLEFSSTTQKSSAFRAFQASKQPKTGRFWCCGPRTGWGLEISSTQQKSSTFRAFQASKQPKNGSFWCGALVDEPRTGWGLEISSTRQKIFRFSGLETLMCRELDGAWKFQASHQNLLLFGLFETAENRKILVRCPCSCTENWMEFLAESSAFRLFRGLKSPKSGRFWCDARNSRCQATIQSSSSIRARNLPVFSCFILVEISRPRSSSRAAHQNLPVFGCSRPEKPELVGPTNKATKSPKSGRFWCGVVDEL